MSRHKLKNRKQTSTETFTNYVKGLKVILMDCEYENPEDILIDCIIDGVADAKLQEKLLDRGEGLTLAKALELGQLHHESKNQLRMLREEVRVDQMKTNSQRSAQRLSQPVNHNPQTTRKCGRCGRSDSHKFCPAASSVCAFCKRKGHWQAVCRNRTGTVNQVHEESDDLAVETCADLEEVLHIYTLDSRSDDRWTATLNANDSALRFRIDTGAKCNVMQKSNFDKIKSQEPIETSKTVLKTYSNHLLKPIGQINIKIQAKTKDTVTARFQIVEMTAENIIPGDLAEVLGLIVKIDNLQQQENKPDLDDYPEVTKTTGLLPGVYKVKLEEGSTGVAHACRKFPPALKDKITAKLQEMEREQFIERVQEPTEWVSSMVVSIKNDKIRTCLDPKDLNKVIKREHHPMRSVEEVAREIPNATVFSKLDAESGFLQIKLDEDSSKLTTFNTPLGRYKWLRLPFGLKCSPEIFQKIMDQMLERIDGAFAIMDDILIAGRYLQHDDEILKKVLRRATDYNLKLNMEKVRIRQKSVGYCGHIISAEGLKADPEKIKAAREMPRPHDKESLRRFLGFAIYLGKFIPNLSQEDQPLRQLLKAENIFQWEDQQEKAFDKLKDLCVKAAVLQYFDVNKPVEVHCDASSTGLGAVLVQDNKPVAYSFRSLTDTETRYAKIEKEMLAIVHACKKFDCFIFGKEVTVFTDHKHWNKSSKSNY
ncbi:Pol polyprotein [Elysia marginata]|uniref:Pol polyprotein n=1 Tax=Elysia marginata TaxID=1093978 RepID=A0AAV4IPC2_9GAST|nr:Pol polyprotein [Elysia marginata]